MKKNLLTEQEEKILFDLSHKPDPTTRLSSNYYLLRRKQIYQDYWSNLQSRDYHDYNERLRFQRQMQEALQQLREEYEADLTQAVELHLQTIGVWQPWRAAS